ncbi:hypothetical protein ACVWWN_005628 [Mycobacterium sp. URHB0021]
MNTAMQDAFNLAWKLAAAVQGEGGQCGAANAPHTILTIAAEIPAPAAGPPDRVRCSSPPTTRRSVATTR